MSTEKKGQAEEIYVVKRIPLAAPSRYKPKPRKYIKGDPIRSMTVLLRRCQVGGWVFLRDKPVSGKFIMQMTIRTVLGFLQSGLVSEAVLNPDAKNKKGL